MKQIITESRFNYNPETKRVELQVKTIPIQTVESRIETDQFTGMVPTIIVTGAATDWVTVPLNEPAPSTPDASPSEAAKTAEAFEALTDQVAALTAENAAIKDQLTNMVDNDTSLAGRVANLEGGVGNLAASAKPAKKKVTKKKAAKKDV